MGVTLGKSEESRISARPTENVAAYEAFLKAQELDRANGLAHSQLMELYERAIALDPNFAQAWANLSWVCTAKYFSVPTPELAERARKAAEKAIELAPDRPEGYRVLGLFEEAIENDLKSAGDLYRRGLAVAPRNGDLMVGTASLNMVLGLLPEALEKLHEAERLDPRNTNITTALAAALGFLGRDKEAREVLDRGLTFEPSNVQLIHDKSVTFLSEGSLAGARSVLRAAPKEVDPTVLVAFMAAQGDFAWALEDDQREMLLRLTPAAFDNDKAAWGLALADADALKGDQESLRVHAEEARKVFEERLPGTPTDAQTHGLLGVVLAYLGRNAEAIQQGERCVALAKEWGMGIYCRHLLARIYTRIGEQEKAVDQLEDLFKRAPRASRGWLNINSNFDPLRKNFRFQKLIASS
jgi:tetratricopeptide (TPR) repeat protein